MLSLVIVIVFIGSAFAMATGGSSQSSVSGEHYFPFQSTSNINKTYNVTFDEKGLPLGTSWTAAMEDLTHNNIFSTNFSNGSSAVISVQNGTYAASASSTGYYPYLNNSNKSYCYIQIDGKSLTVNVTFVKTYDINFTESGLSKGSEWIISLANASMESNGISYSYDAYSSNYLLPEINGTWFYNFSTTVHGLFAHPPGGSITISGHNVSVMVNFTSSISISYYTVNFTESGLPSGTAWGVNLNGSEQTSTTNTASFVEPNGTYSYEVSSSLNYSASPSYGSITVNGHNVTIQITFSPPLPPVWAFTGAYATYKATGYNSSGNVNFNLQMKILSVNYKYETVSILTRFYNSTVNSLQYENNTSWNNVGLWLDQQKISILNNGSGFFGFSNVTTNVTVTTPAGIFLTDEVYIPNGSAYFDRYSGIVVKFDYSNSSANVSLEIESTNINTTVTHSYSVAFTESGLPSGTPILD